MNTTQDGNPPVNPTHYTKELYLQHVQAFWEGKLEWMNPFSDEWATSINPPNPTELPSRFRIKQPKALRPWKPEEIPLGAWIRKKDSTGTSIIVASIKGCAVWLHEIDEEFYKTPPGALLELFEHSTDSGKTWLPCGVEE